MIKQKASPQEKRRFSDESVSFFRNILIAKPFNPQKPFGSNRQMR